MSQADTPTLDAFTLAATYDTTYAVQLRDNTDGSWHWWIECDTEGAAHKFGRNVHGDEVIYRVVTITRTAGEAVMPS